VKKLTLNRQVLCALTPEQAATGHNQQAFPDWTTITTIFSEVVSCHLR